MTTFQTYTKNWFKKESAPAKKKRAAQVLTVLKKTYPRSKIALNYGTDIQLLIAVILSAQCTDKKVNEVTETLFKKYKTARDFMRANQKTLEKEIRQTGFFRTKAKHIIEAAKKIESEFGGRLPRTMAELITLAGVARKTANIVLGNAYGIVEGIAVDTHVGRLSQRLGFSNNTDPVKIEQDLMCLFPRKEWFLFTYKLIDHGRAICTAKNRNCRECPLNKLCPSVLRE